MLLVDPAAHSVSNPVKGPTFGFKAPWQYVEIIYTATDSIGMWGDGTDPTADFPAIDCFSRDQLEMKIDVMVRWQLDESKIKKLYENYPLKNWKDTIASIIREQIRLATKEWSAIQTIEYRDVVRQKIATAIESKIAGEKSLEGAVINFEFELRNIKYPTAYTEAIEAKLAAEQAKIQAEYEAERMITLANADAAKLLIAANATAQQKIIDAQGIQEAIKTLLGNSSLSEENYSKLLNTYITLKALEQIANKEGVYFFIGTDGTILLQPQK
ncbi:MAG: SPFH domain-containing protein [Candidatus Bathyarchaeia archaeon]